MDYSFLVRQCHTVWGWNRPGNQSPGHRLQGKTGGSTNAVEYELDFPAHADIVPMCYVCGDFTTKAFLRQQLRRLLLVRHLWRAGSAACFNCTAATDRIVGLCLLVCLRRESDALHSPAGLLICLMLWSFLPTAPTGGWTLGCISWLLPPPVWAVLSLAVRRPESATAEKHLRHCSSCTGAHTGQSVLTPAL